MDSSPAYWETDVVARCLPTGTVTFLFTDVEGSTALLTRIGNEAYGQLLAEHHRLIRNAVGAVGGAEVDTQGEAFFAAFPTAVAAIKQFKAANKKKIKKDAPEPTEGGN